MRGRRAAIVVAAVVAIVVLTFAFVWWAPPTERAFLPFPSDKSCVVAVTDDTDFFQFDTTAPVYALIDSLGLRVTKTVWAFDHEDHPSTRAGLSLDDPAYRDWVLAEAARGHEIALHSATAGHDERSVTVEAHRYVADLIGERPRIIVFHSSNREAFYWGAHRIPNPVLRQLYRMRTGDIPFEGADPESPYYWIDVSRWLVCYVRGYTTNSLNTIAVNPSMPYADPWSPASPLWCASSNGRVASDFVSLLRPPNVERFKEQGGVSVVYTHFASGFTEPGRSGGWQVTPEVRETLLRCGTDSEIEFAPAGEVLDRLRLVQILEDAASGAGSSAGRTAVAIPFELAPAIDGISVVPSRLHAPLNAPADGDESVPLRVWLDAVDWELAPGEMSVFDLSRPLPLRERWRLVLRWIAISLTSGASDYRLGA